MFRAGTVDVPQKRVPQPIVNKDGYVRLWVSHDHPMANAQGYTYVHRLVMAAHIGRHLYPFENVHHKNGNRRDNRLENLELWAKPPTPGQRVDDLIAFVVAHYREQVVAALTAT